VRASLKPTPAIYQPKYPQLKTKSSSEPSTSRNPLFDTKDLTSNYSEVRSETRSITPVEQKGKSPIENLSTADISSTLQLNFMTSHGLEEYFTHPSSTPVGSPDYISCKSEEPIPRIPYQSSLDFSPREESKDSLLIFQNPLYNFPLITMETTGGGGGGVVRGGGGGAPGGGARGQGPAPLPECLRKWQQDMILWYCSFLCTTFPKIV
jgi:hypothetical protein